MSALLAHVQRGPAAELSIKGILSHEVACVMLQISNEITIPNEEIYVQAVRAQGAGGQNVNGCRAFPFLTSGCNKGLFSET
jgi:protein subunit release factor A